MMGPDLAGSAPAHLVAATELTRFTQEALACAGARSDDARLTADVLVAADLGGVESHGVARLRRYVEGLRDGDIKSDALPEIISDAGAVCVVDAHNGLGQPALCVAVDLAIDRARMFGTSVAMVRRSNHMGIAGWFTERAAKHGMLAVVMTNAVPQVAPMGTNEPMFGTDPISYAVPGTNGTLCYDAATSVVSRGKLEQLDRTNKQMLPGWALGPDGRGTTDIPRTVAGLKAREGYALLPLGGGDQAYGGHKGSGLALFVELLCGPLAGAEWSRHTYEGDEAGLGHFVFCLNLEALGDSHAVADGVERLASEVRNASPADPGTAVRIPGDRRRALTETRLRCGVPVLDSVLEDLREIADLIGVTAIRPSDGGP